MKIEPLKLVETASTGDREAAERLLEIYLPHLQKFMARRAGAALLAKESASDLVQSVCREALEQLAESKLRFRGEPEFRRWLYTAALLKLSKKKRHYHAEKRDVAREARASLSGLERSRVDAFFQSIVSPSSAAAQREMTERLEKAFEKLPENFREIVVLARIDGLSHAEIGEKLGISEGNSRVLLSRALARLAAIASK